ncbi:MAG: CHASE2:Stage sporulation [Proteobacteria bacterium]|nr:CHASE2:Stage sporulation [Pseudomonadota bacterium]
MAQPQTGGESSWNLPAIWHRLSFCWRDPEASAEVRATHRVRQFQALCQQLPVSAFDCIVCSLIYVVLFWNEANRGLIVAWCLLIWAIWAGGLGLWRTLRHETESRRCVSAARWMTGVLAISGVLFALMFVYLFGVTDTRGQILLAAFFGTTVTHGAFHNARWPWAGGLWGTGMCLVGAVALLFFYGLTYLYLAVILALYSISVLASVLINSRLFVRKLMAESEVERQRDVIGLLLNDFEGEASDWLWECDANGRLTHVSPRLAEVLGASQDVLLGRSMVSLLAERSPDGAQVALGEVFQRSAPFRAIEVSIGHGETLHWWSLGGKPLLDASGLFAGWRGVGSDITAEVMRREIERQLGASREEAARVAAELDAARRIQLGLLPDLVAGFVGERRFSISAILEPAREVGGDYYECFQLDAQRICFAVADVSGKGIPASLFMAMTKVLTASLTRRSDDLGWVVGEISRELDGNNTEMLFVTAFIAVLNLDGGALDFVSAGHDAPLLLRNGGISRLDLAEALGPPMCSVPDYAYTAGRAQLLPGDTLCLFTDGLTEACDGQDYFGSARLQETLSGVQPGVSVGEVAIGLRDEVRRFEAGQMPADDLTIMVMRWQGHSSNGEAQPA